METISKTDNELIAEFMGGWQGHITGEWKIFAGHGLYSEKELMYDRSWDWLMPVVEKISDYAVWTIRPEYVEVRSFAGELRKEKQFKFNTDRMDWETIGDEAIPFIFLVNSVVVEFIKWHNKQSHA